ncbi:hypothetical protein HPB50_024844 [Hyalomma asiaticum]|uniref:Uncharacterized protein n=1 Tax=Hyalomma asiaticum TaxID=266040 RepID=A0ACB7SA57_HYAAI|nr:hypothetical protein HPB50_024844 [Hyalomma asiaticum]
MCTTVKMGGLRSEPTDAKEDFADVLRRADEEMQWLIGATLALLVGSVLAAVLVVSWACVCHEILRDFRQSVLILWDTLLLRDPCDHSGREMTRGGRTPYVYIGDAGVVGVARLKAGSTRMPESGLFGAHVTRERLHPWLLGPELRHRRGRD